MTRTAKSDPTAFVPLKPDVFAILLVLLQESAHGYAIMQRAAERAPGVDLQPGALYRLLKRMLDDGLIEELELEGHGDGRRRSYEITAFGRSVASAEARRMDELVSASRRHALLGDAESA